MENKPRDYPSAKLKAVSLSNGNPWASIGYRA
jgi:hypothetical protein